MSGLWIATLGNWPLWRALVALPETDSARGMVFVLGFATMLAALLAALLCVFAWRFSIKAVIGLFLISAALGAHFMGAYGVVIDPTMMANVLQTDLREASDLMNVRLLVSRALVLTGHFATTSTLFSQPSESFEPSLRRRDASLRSRQVSIAQFHLAHEDRIHNPSSGSSQSMFLFYRVRSYPDQ